MGALRFVDLDRSIDHDVVTQEAEYETRVHPEGREDGDGNPLEGEYQDLVAAEEYGVATFVVIAEAYGFEAGEKAQVDISLSGGWREFKIVDLPAGGDEETPERFTVEFGPGPVKHASGLATVLAYRADESGTLLDEPWKNEEGTLSYPELARLAR